MIYTFESKMIKKFVNIVKTSFKGSFSSMISLYYYTSNIYYIIRDRNDILEKKTKELLLENKRVTTIDSRY